MPSLLLRIVFRAERDMMDNARPQAPMMRIRYTEQINGGRETIARARTIAETILFVTDRLKPHHFHQEFGSILVSLLRNRHAVKPTNTLLDRNGTVGPGLAFRLRHLHRTDDFQAHSVRVSKANEAFSEAINHRLQFHTFFLQPLGPIVDCAHGNSKRGDRDLRWSDSTAIRAGPGKESHDRSRTPQFVAVVEVIAPGIIKIHRQFHEPQAQHAAIEVDVLLRISGDGGDMMETRDRFLRGRHNWSI